MGPRVRGAEGYGRGGGPGTAGHRDARVRGAACLPPRSTHRTEHRQDDGQGRRLGLYNIHYLVQNSWHRTTEGSNDVTGLKTISLRFV